MLPLERVSHTRTAEENFLMRRAFYLAVLALFGIAFYQYQPGLDRAPLTGTASGAEAGDHFSPTENLERLDIEQISRARHTLDIAMYAFTDRYLAQAVMEAAHRGVKVRIYRDRSQFEEEQRNADVHHERSLSDMFHRQPNVQVRVKDSNQRNLMHLKAYLVDGALLRDGSANWSPSGLKQQDNNAHFTTDPAQVHAFQQAFEEMWSRSRNQVAH
jgi:phosphatidylserine/phosphatidylglycerophosphate/cardiolipin synthase-like enzyme